jgi:hypothetical protein
MKKVGAPGEPPAPASTPAGSSSDPPSVNANTATPIANRRESQGKRIMAEPPSGQRSDRLIRAHRTAISARGHAPKVVSARGIFRRLGTMPGTGATGQQEVESKDGDLC